MHRMIRHELAFDRQESAGADVKAYGLGIDPPLTDTGKDRISKMQSCRRRRDGTAEAGIQRLVPLEVYRLGLPVEIRRNGNGSAGLKHGGKRGAVRPREFDQAGLALAGEQAGLQIHRLDGRIVLVAVQPEHIVLPTLCIADNAAPDAAVDGRENSAVFSGFYGLEAENLYMRAGRTLEMKTGGNHLGVVEHHNRIFRKKVREVPEDEFVHLAVTVAQKF